MSQPLYSNLGFEQPLEIAKGSTFKMEFEVLADGAAKVPYDLTDHVVRAVLASVDGEYQTEFICDITEPQRGIAHARLEPTQTIELAANDRRMSINAYRWACEIKTPQGEIIPYCYGPVAVRSNGIDWS